MINRCVNIDWLEVYCLESIERPRDAQYFLNAGFKVVVRDYGTPQYKQMFTIYDADGFPQFEVRRCPYSIKSNGGIFAENACHIRLSNRACYKENPIHDLRSFLLSYGYQYQNLSRIDICLDFNTFDTGETPENFIKKYTTEKISKLNQSAFYQFGRDISNIYMHGKDAWCTRVINSIKWGSDTSSITTKMYNKSLELRQRKDKFYIRDAWAQSGLSGDVWRVEFSLNSSFKLLDLKKEAQGLAAEFKIKDSEMSLHNLCNYDSRDKLLFYFHVLSAKYFQFRNKEYTKNGTVKPKQRCSLHSTFKLSQSEKAYQPIKLTHQTEPTRTDKMLLKRLIEIIDDKDSDPLLRESATEVAIHISNTKRLAQERFANGLVLRVEKENPKRKCRYINIAPKPLRRDMFGIIPEDCPF